MDLVTLPGNDVCADCKAKAPRWASFNLGIFLCVRCASIHRKIGTHVTKVKSLTLDQWSKEQVETMKNIGNIKSNAYWNPDEKKNPLPTNMEETERDSELEKFIRSKYEFKRFRSKSSLVAEQLGPSQSLASRTANLPKRSQTAPIRSEPSTLQTAPKASEAPPPLPFQTQQVPPSGNSAPAMQTRSFSSQYPVASSLPPRSSSFNPFPTSSNHNSNASISVAPPPNHAASLTSSTFNDLISVQTPALNSSLPLQYQTSSPTVMSSTNPFPIQPQPTSLNLNPGNPYANMSTSPALPSSFPNGFGNIRSVSLPVPGYNETSSGTQVNSMSGMGMNSMNPMSTSPFQPSISPSASLNMSGSPNPFNQLQQQQQTVLLGQQQQQSPFAPSISPSIPAFQSSTSAPTSQSFTPGGFGQAPAPFGTSLGAGIYQPPSGVSPSSPYATQIQQAQQLFQGMTPGAGGGSNPFRSQWQ